MELGMPESVELVAGDHTVLIVDPEEAFRCITIKAVEPLGCRILTASEGLQALDAAVREVPDLVLLDAQLPGISGIEVCRRMMRDDVLRHIPVIFLSASHDFQARVDALNAGAVDFVMKPFLIAELQARVRTQLRMRQLLKHMVALHERERERERAESVHLFAVGIGHNFNNLLTAGLGFLSLASDEVHDHKAMGYLRNMELVMKRMCSLARQLLAFTGDLALQKRVVSVHRILTMAVGIFDPVALNSRVAMVCDFGRIGNASLLCDEFRLTQAVLHLLNNARESLMPGGGQIFFKAYIDGDVIVIEVTDHGGGMSPEQLQRAREPFFTTREDVGHGLGLSMVDGVARDLGGEMLIESVEGDSTTVSLQLPLSPEAAGDAAVFGGEFEEGVHILVAVDAEETRQAIQAVLVSSHFYVHPVESWEEMREELTAAPDRYGALVVDLLRSDLFGDELMENIRGRTDAPVVYLVSTPNEAPSAQASLQILRKPFEPEELLQTLRQFPQLVRYS